MVGGMGFWDLAKFNDILLVEQAWRLMHNEKSLFYWVFKARLFPNCSILEAKNSKSGSYAWKSILKGWEVIKKGAKWSVGNGSSIKIWSDSWLPGNGNGKVLTPVVDSMRVITVDLVWLSSSAMEGINHWQFIGSPRCRKN